MSTQTPCSTILGGKPCGVCDGGGGGGITGINVASDGVVGATNVQALNFVPDGGVLIEVSEPVNGIASIEVAHPIVPPVVPVFGQDYNEAHTPQEITSNNAAWTDVLDLVAFISGGLYRLAWSSEVDSNGTYINLRVIHDPSGGPLVVLAMGEITAGALHDPHGGIVTGLVLDAGAHEFKVQISSGGPPTTVGARRTRLDFWKVGTNT